MKKILNKNTTNKTDISYDLAEGFTLECSESHSLYGWLRVINITLSMFGNNELEEFMHVTGVGVFFLESQIMSTHDHIISITISLPV